MEGQYCITDLSLLFTLLEGNCHQISATPSDVFDPPFTFTRGLLGRDLTMLFYLCRKLDVLIFSVNLFMVCKISQIDPEKSGIV